MIHPNLAGHLGQLRLTVEIVKNKGSSGMMVLEERHGREILLSFAQFTGIHVALFYCFISPHTVHLFIKTHIQQQPVGKFLLYYFWGAVHNRTQKTFESGQSAFETGL